MRGDAPPSHGADGDEVGSQERDGAERGELVEGDGGAEADGDEEDGDDGGGEDGVEGDVVDDLAWESVLVVDWRG